MAIVTRCCCSWHDYMLFKLQAVVAVLVAAVLVSEETKFEVDTISIILSLHHFENVNKELFRCY